MTEGWRVWVQTRGFSRAHDYRWFPDGAKDLPPDTSPWNEVVFSGLPSGVLHGDRSSWFLYLNEIPSNRTDAVNTPVSWSLYIKGACDTTSVAGVQALLEKWIQDGSKPLGELLDLNFAAADSWHSEAPTALKFSSLDEPMPRADRGGGGPFTVGREHPEAPSLVAVTVDVLVSGRSAGTVLCSPLEDTMPNRSDVLVLVRPGRNAPELYKSTGGSRSPEPRVDDRPKVVGRSRIIILIGIALMILVIAVGLLVGLTR